MTSGFPVLDVRAREGNHRRCRRGSFALARSLPLGHALGTHLQVCAARLSALRRRYADYRLRNQMAFRYDAYWRMLVNLPILGVCFPYLCIVSDYV